MHILILILYYIITLIADLCKIDHAAKKEIAAARGYHMVPPSMLPCYPGLREGQVDFAIDNSHVWRCFPFINCAIYYYHMQIAKDSIHYHYSIKLAKRAQII